MDGLLLALPNDGYSPGKSFWPCFKPLRSMFDQHHWIFANQPWMGAPIAFDHEIELADFEGSGETSISLWRPKSIGRWADKFAEEDVELWATSHAQDPARVATEFQRTPWKEKNRFIETHAEIWLIYTDSTCWELFVRRKILLQPIRDHLLTRKAARVFENASDDRAAAYRAAGIGRVWDAM